MRFCISPTILKQQVKLMVKYWPFSPIRSSQARELLCCLYGYKNNHDYQLEMKRNSQLLTEISSEVVVSEYPQWVKRLADLASINQIQAKNLLHKLWPAYLLEKAPLSMKLYQCKIRFHGECNDFLKADSRAKWVLYDFDDRPSVKDTIEAIGVPHTEIGAISLSRAESIHGSARKFVDFGCLLMNKDILEVYSNPHSSSLLPFRPSGKLTFLLDVHLGRLARYLRMAGFDCLHESKDYGDKLLAELSHVNNYILLTRDIGLLKRSKVRYGRWVRNTDTGEQFREVVEHYQLSSEAKPFSRCVKCNGSISSISKNAIKGVVPDGIYHSYDDYQYCKQCKQVYWKGTHYQKINEILSTVI